MNRKVDSSQLWIIGLKDKELLDEPIIAFGVFEAPTQDDAVRIAMDSKQFAAYAARHCRSYCCAIGGIDMPLQLDHFYRMPK